MSLTHDRSDTPVLSTLTHGLQIVECLANGRSNVRELSEVTGLGRQNVYRLLRTLIARRWVNRDARDDSYHLTSVVWALAARSFRLGEVRDALAGTIRQLADDEGETVHLATYDHGSVIYVDKADGWHPIRSYTELGGTAPAYCVATGKLMLALQPRTEQERVLSGPLERKTPRTLADPAALRRELDDARARLFTVNRGEWRESVAGVAVPVAIGAHGAAAAIGFSGPVDRILPRVEALTESLRAGVRAAGFGELTVPAGAAP